MDLSPTPEQRWLRESARSFLASACPIDHVRAMETDARGFSPDLWREIAALGWTGILVPEAYGGSGRTFLDATVLLEEMGRVLLPSPFLTTSIVVPSLFLALGDEDEKRRTLPGVATGDVIATLALVEPGWRDEWGEPALEAVPDSGGIRLSGTKLFVPFASHAHLLLVAARGGMLAALEESEAEFTRLATLGGDPCYEVALRGARARLVQSQARGAIERALLHAAVATTAIATGAAERVLEMTVEHAKIRTQFGRPIGSFQAIAHRAAEMRSDLDALRYLVYQAAWALSSGRSGELESRAAKAYGNDALRRFFQHAHQIHGAIGFSTEHDLQLFTRRAKAAELQWGGAAAHRERVARAMGLG